MALIDSPLAFVAEIGASVGDSAASILQWSWDLVSKPLTFILISLIALTIGRLFLLRSKRSFFGLDGHRAGAIQILLSNLSTRPGGTRGVIPLNSGYTGDAITLGEYSAARQLADQLDRVPTTRWLAALGLPKGYEFTSERVCAIDVSPSVPKKPRPMFDESGQCVLESGVFPHKAKAEMEAQLEKAQTAILIGSPIYNTVTDYLLGRCAWTENTLGHVRFVRRGGPGEAGRYCLALQTQGAWEALTRADRDQPHALEYFLVAKVVRPSSAGHRMAFVCCGTSVRATVWAVRTLTEEWRTMHKQFGRQEFCLTYSLSTDDPEYDDAGAYGDDAIALIDQRSFAPLAAV